MNGVYVQIRRRVRRNRWCVYVIRPLDGTSERGILLSILVSGGNRFYERICVVIVVTNFVSSFFLKSLSFIFVVCRDLGLCASAHRIPHRIKFVHHARTNEGEKQTTTTWNDFLVLAHFTSTLIFKYHFSVSFALCVCVVHEHNLSSLSLFARRAACYEIW